MSGDWICQTVRDLPPSGIRAFFETAANNKRLIQLGVGEPDFRVPESVRKACISALNRGETGYSSNAGLPELRREIAGYLSAGFGLRYDPGAEIIVTAGSSEALDITLRTVISPGDEVLIPSPGYVAYAPMVTLSGGSVLPVETKREEGFKLTAEALRRSITPRTKALMVNYPNNPTGAVMTRRDWEPIAELAVRHNLIVISDEVYAELTYGDRHVSVASLPGMKERTIVISGFSKAFAMTGWRVGYCCASGELAAAMLKIHQYIAMCASVPGQIAALESLRSGLESKDRMKAAFDARRTLFVEGLNALGLPCHMPDGAFYAFPSVAGTGLTSEQFALRLLREAGVAVVPGSVFGPGGEGHIRCSYAASAEQLAEALGRIGRFMESLSAGDHTLCFPEERTKGCEGEGTEAGAAAVGS
ncbi:aminotransferase class I/II-fold pyridoxal phosphate-dependent enzyme [Paenibacillus sp. URB8-2]|uniref:aminotransferase class I/II-fold pyridoxal phosphate-dependent enzyme n=1 Tax=Paenibacillus sp. URB8-2 TaxID=2741301 RepID=UPI0015B87938|nr:aminotransferase class I/II-fold pyridoxal phosphate-dependent enzyme [Paenibacillus sp. URB8-2]BCG57901.1 aminotransferase [Paenibacillus sp. URB8-2]